MADLNVLQRELCVISEAEECSPGGGDLGVWRRPFLILVFDTQLYEHGEAWVEVGSFGGFLGVLYQGEQWSPLTGG